MVTVKKVRGSRVRIRNVGRFERGDQADVSEETARYLTEERGDFELVDTEPGDDDVREEDGPPDDDMEYEERTALAEGLANESWQSAVATVEDGDADEYLDVLEKIDDRNSVQKAIANRRDELED